MKNQQQSQTPSSSTPSSSSAACSSQPQQINFSDLSEEQKQSYLQYLIDNEIPLEQDNNQQSEDDCQFLAKISFPAQRKSINSKYSTTEKAKSNTPTTPRPLKVAATTVATSTATPPPRTTAVSSSSSSTLVQHCSSSTRNSISGMKPQQINFQASPINKYAISSSGALKTPSTPNSKSRSVTPTATNRSSFQSQKTTAPTALRVSTNQSISPHRSSVSSQATSIHKSLASLTSIHKQDCTKPRSFPSTNLQDRTPPPKLTTASATIANRPSTIQCFAPPPLSAASTVASISPTAVVKKPGNILIVDSETTSSRSSSRTTSAASNEFSQLAPKRKAPTPLGQQRMSEIFEILRSVGFKETSSSISNCSGSTHDRSWTDAAEMLTDPQELSLKSIDPYDMHSFEINQFKDFSWSQSDSDDIHRIHCALQAISPASATTPSSIQKVNQAINKYCTPSYKQPQSVLPPTPPQPQPVIEWAILQQLKHRPTRVSKLPIQQVICQIEEVLIAFAHSYGIKEGMRMKRKNQSFDQFVLEYLLISKTKKPVVESQKRLAEVNAFNFLKSVEFHYTSSDGTQHTQHPLVSAFVFFLGYSSSSSPSKELLSMIIIAYLTLLNELLIIHKTKSLLSVSISEKMIFKINSRILSSTSETYQNVVEQSLLGLFAAKEPLCKKDGSVAQLGCYEYLDAIIIQLSTVQVQQQQFYDDMKEITDHLSGSRCRTTSPSPMLYHNHNSNYGGNSSVPPQSQNQHLFQMVNDSFGGSYPVNGEYSSAHTHASSRFNSIPVARSNSNGRSLHIVDSKQVIEWEKQSLQSSSISSNDVHQFKSEDSQRKGGQLSSILKQPSWKMRDDQLIGGYVFRNGTNNNCMSKLEEFMLSEMRAIVVEFVDLFDVANGRQSAMLRDMILKKCRLLLLSLIKNQGDKWFELLAIALPNSQQKMQAETIQKLFEAYKCAFFTDGLTDEVAKNIRQLCKLMLKIPEVSDAVSKLLIVMLEVTEEQQQQQELLDDNSDE